MELKWAVKGFVSGHYYSFHRLRRCAEKKRAAMARADRAIPWTYMVVRV